MLDFIFCYFMDESLFILENDNEVLYFLQILIFMLAITQCSFTHVNIYIYIYIYTSLKTSFYYFQDRLSNIGK